MRYNWFYNETDFSLRVPGTKNISLDVVGARIDSVTDRYFIKGFLDAVTVQSLLDYIQANPNEDSNDVSGTGVLYEAALLARSFVAHMTLALSADDLDVAVSASGFTVGEGDRANIASSNRVLKYKEARYEDAQQLLDDLYSYLEANVNDNALTTYKNSAARKNNKLYFVNTKSEWQKFITPNINYFVLQQMLPIVNYVEAESVKRVLGDELFRFMKLKLKNSEDLGAYAPLLPMVQEATATLSFATALEELGLKVTPSNGVFFSFFKNANDAEQSERAKGADIWRPTEAYRKRGERALEKLREELLKNLSNYPLFEASSAYSAPKANYTTNDKPGRNINFGI